MGNTCHGRSSSLWCWENEILLPTKASKWAQVRHFVLTCLCTPAWTWVTVRLLLPNLWDKSPEASGGCVSLPSPNPATLLRIHGDRVAISTESGSHCNSLLLPLWEQLDLYLFLRGSVSPAGAMIIQNFPLAVVNPFLKQRRTRSSGSLRWNCGQPGSQCKKFRAYHSLRIAIKC